MKRVIRVWRILAVAFVCLVFLAAAFVTITGSPHHVFLKEIYDFLGIMGSDPPPKYILFFALILFAEIPFMIKVGDNEKASLSAAEQGSDAARDTSRELETKENLNDKLKIALERAKKEARERAEQKAREREEKEARERAEKEARERAEKEARERAEKEAREREEKKTRARAVKPEPRKEWPEPDWLGDVQAAAEVRPSLDVSMEAADFDRFLSELKAELFEE